MESLYLYLGGYVLLLLGISLWLARKNSSEDFLIAGRNRNQWQLFFSQYSGAVSVAWFITFSAFVYQFGISTLSAGLGYVVSYLLFALWAGPRIHKDSKKNKYYTQGDYVLDKTNSTASKKLVDVTSIINSFLQILVGVIGGAKLISFLSPISYEYALIITASVILLYIAVSGYRAVLLTDIVQSVVILLLLLLSVLFLLNTESLNTILSIQTETMSTGTIIGFLVFGIFSVFGRSERYQLCFSANTVKDVKRGFSLAVIPIIFTMALLVVIGLYMYSQNQHLDPDLTFIQFFTQHLPQGFVVFGAMIFFAALMGSADTDVYTAASYASFLKKRKNHVSNTRTMIVIIIGIVTLVGFVFRDVVAVGILSGITLVTTSVAMIYIISGGKNYKRFIASIVTAIIFCLIALIFIGLQPTALIPTVLGGAIGLLYPLKNPFKKKGLPKGQSGTRRR
jgi:solute:Na+ symporter, SSS family